MGLPICSTCVCSAQASNHSNAHYNTYNFTAKVPTPPSGQRLYSIEQQSYNQVVLIVVFCCVLCKKWPLYVCGSKGRMTSNAGQPQEWATTYTGHPILVTMYWSPYTGHPIMGNRLYWSPYTGHPILGTLYWAPYPGHPILGTLYWSPYTEQPILVTLY